MDSVEFFEMITRAQAEALLTLAESLEACERVGLGARLSPILGKFFIGGYSGALSVNAAQLRTAVADLMPKTPGEEYSYTVGPKGVTNQTWIVKRYKG